MQPLYISETFIAAQTNFKALIAVLEHAFAVNTTLVPQRHHHDFPLPNKTKDSTLLLMPAWNPGEDSGVKVVTINPYNSNLNLPAIQGSYLYMDALTGQLKAIVEAKSLTAKRTAATSALASKYMSRPNASTLLMIGTGALSENLIKAHAAVRPITTVYVWGRNPKKAQTIVDQLQGATFTVQVAATIASVIAKADIVSCATLSETPLVLGEHLVAGQHIDLVGAYKPNMREADDNAIKKATVFVDAFGGGLQESGDIAIPLKNGVLKESDIAADLFALAAKERHGRTAADQITLFKSVGHALEDLAAAKYYYQNYSADDNL